MESEVVINNFMETIKIDVGLNCDQINGQIDEKIENNINNENNYQNYVNRENDTFSEQFNRKSLEEKMKIMMEFDIVLKRMSKFEIINDYKIDFLGVKKYYELESDDESDHNIINNNNYNKCNQNESCVRLQEIFENHLTDEGSGFETTARPRGRRKRRKYLRYSAERPKKRSKISDRLTEHTKRSIDRSSDGKFLNKTIITSNDINPNNSHKQEVILLNSQNNVINIINNKRIGANLVKNKKRTPKNSSNKKKTNDSLIKPKQDLNKTVDNKSFNSLFNESTICLETKEFKTFMGTRLKSSDLLRKCNNCENGCEIDELTLAFHLLMSSSEDELPNDLRINYNLDSDESEVTDREIIENQINNESDLIFNDFNVQDIYQQTIDEDIQQNMDPCLAAEIENFFRNTTTNSISAQQSNDEPFFDPLLIPSTSGYTGVNSDHINTEEVFHPDLGVILKPEVLPTVSPLILNSSEPQSTNTNPIISSNPILNSLTNIDLNTNTINSPTAGKSINDTPNQASDNESINSSTNSITVDSPKKIVYTCFYCLETFDRSKKFRQHCKESHPKLALRCTAKPSFSPISSPQKTTTSTPITTTTASVLNFSLNSNTAQVFIVNEPQNISITPTVRSVKRKIQFTDT